MIADPRLSGREAAARFGVSPVWISIVKNSPIFRAEFEKRRERICQTFEERIVGKATAVAELSLEIMSERIERDGDIMPLGQLIKSTSFAAKLLGYGPGKGLGPGAAPVQVQINAVGPEVLAEAREKMRQLDKARDAEEKSVPAAAPEWENPVKSS